MLWSYRGWRLAALVVVAVLFAAVLFTGSRAAAQDATAQLDYTRAPGAQECPDDTTLRDAVSARLGYVPFRDDAERIVRVRVERLGRRVRASVEVLDATGTVIGGREIATRSASDACAIEDALVLAVSLAIDPMTLAAHEPMDDAPVCPAAPDPPTCPACVVCDERDPRDDGLAGDARDVGRSVRGRFVASAAFEVAPLPFPTGGLRLGGGARMGDFSVDVEVRGDVPTTGGDDSGRAASAMWLAGALVLCGHVEAFVACGLTTTGALLGWGSGVDRPLTQVTGFATAGARVGFEVPVSSDLSVTGGVEGALVITPTTLVVDARDIHTTAPVTFAAHLGVLVEIF